EKTFPTATLISHRRSAARPPCCFDRDFQASRRVLRPQPRLIVQGRSLLPETSHSIATNFSGSPLFDLELQKLGVSQFFLTLKTLLMKLRMNVVLKHFACVEVEVVALVCGEKFE